MCSRMCAPARRCGALLVVASQKAPAYFRELVGAESLLQRSDQDKAIVAWFEEASTLTYGKSPRLFRIMCFSRKLARRGVAFERIGVSQTLVALGSGTAPPVCRTRPVDGVRSFLSAGCR